MPKIQMLNMEGKSIQEVELKKDIFDVEVSEHAVYLAVKNILANRYQGTQLAKTRVEVHGGGRKPWRQEGTGHARRESIRFPQWKGGGVVSVPRPRDCSYTTPKKVKRLALRSVLTSKVQESELIFADALELEETKIKAMAQAPKVLNTAKKSLILVGEGSESVACATKNTAGVRVLNIQSINVYDLPKYDSPILGQEALNKIQEVR